MFFFQLNCNYVYRRRSTAKFDIKCETKLDSHDKVHEFISIWNTITPTLWCCKGICLQTKQISAWYIYGDFIKFKASPAKHVIERMFEYVFGVFTLWLCITLQVAWKAMPVYNWFWLPIRNNPMNVWHYLSCKSVDGIRLCFWLSKIQSFI